MRELQELFIGLALDRDQDIPFVELANGGCAHVHLIVEDEGFQVLLLDAEEASAEAHTASLRAGADYYLTKPLNIEQFVGVMQRAAHSDWNRSSA